MTPHEKYARVVEASNKKLSKAVAKLEAEYGETIKPSYEKYRAVRKKADAAYDKICNPARRVRETTLAPSLKVWQDAKTAAGAVLKRKKREVQRVHSKIRRAASDEYERWQRAEREKREKKS